MSDIRSGLRWPGGTVTGEHGRGWGAEVADWPTVALTCGDGKYAMTGAPPGLSDGGAAFGALPQEVSRLVPWSKLSVAPCRVGGARAGL
jgi:hypothetical protein